MGKVIIGYKAFDKDLACRGFQYEAGKTYELEGKLEICKIGFHFCENLADCFKYYPTNSRIAEVIALGKIITQDDKSCTDKIHILRELSQKEIFQKTNIGIGNTDILNEGNYNSGIQNCGKYNSGGKNKGNYNSGANNKGNYNSGDNNIGDENTGESNIGNYNTGDHNRGNGNVGSCNCGANNSGLHNVGNYNAGDGNIGNYNTGDFNKSDWCLGALNTEPESQYIRLFNKESNLTFNDWKDHPAKKVLIYIYNLSFSGRNKQSIWESLLQPDKEAVLNLPNFDAAIFKEITGIDVNLKDTIEKLVSNT